MRFLFFIFSLIVILNNDIQAQSLDTTSIEKLFLEQISYFPQEKIYVQTDRNVYLPEETIWFRAHLVDALFLKQANASRYIYVEFINPLDSIIQRVKIRPDSTGCFYGSIQLDADLAEGNYTLRAYTRFMQNQGNDYFFHKSIYITDLMTEKMLPSIRFFEDNKKIKAEISFIDKTDNEKKMPEQGFIFYDGDTEKEGLPLTFENDMSYYTFNEKNIRANRVVLLQAVFEYGVYNFYLKIPSLDKSFDVTFFPEGGYAPVSSDIKMAFKSINSEGLSEDIKGQVFDDLGQPYTSFESSHLGMGHFRMYYSPGRKYHAICTNKDNVSKRFELPDALDKAVSLKTFWNNNFLRITLAKSPDYRLPVQTKLIAHIKGAVIYEQLWDDKKEYLTFERDFFPTGIIHLLLIDEERNILSERLVFSTQGSIYANTDVITDKAHYVTRDKVNLKIQVLDEDKVPLSGNISMSIVDTKDIKIDTTNTIISTLLLSSELKGYIESPMSYLMRDNKKSEQSLDVLMLTQGWRRYDVPKILKGEIKKDLQYPVELGDVVTGKAEGLFTALKEGGISLIAFKDSVLGTSITHPDQKGRFRFEDLEYPEGTNYMIQALNKKGSNRVFLEIDKAQGLPPLAVPILDRADYKLVNDNYLTKMGEKYMTENGIRIYNLSSVTVSAKRKLRESTTSPYYSISSSRVLTEDDVNKSNILSVFSLLQRLPGISVIGNEVRHRNSIPLTIIDNIPEENFNYEDLDIGDIKEVFFTPAISVMPIFGTRAASGAIIINTKKGYVEKNKINNNIKIMKPIGYKQVVEFYSPTYSTKEEKDSKTLDLRTTIYWNPNVQLDSTGSATLSFYTADSPSQYRVVIEGMSSFGHLIHSSQYEISVTQDN
ncbi:TonB-dependent receptor [Dysgonomonas sp. Marseille-P4677]|uniref:MG2 domain-containing protein n=1 Tax=Dysgonomonas sp. Marseille-P4677 TaxID=2364790 RepID=UPI0019140D3C|nr:MG2 domain-containing protein [Dysgonomonas sp. Marseille-P4677]MBK5720337.1 TonB-dependent receptor [Dysgonomonas sp. Marseille-P4677]